MDDQVTTPAKTILLADDDQFITIAYKAGLERAGYDVTIASDGEETIQHIMSARPHLILLDIIMPKVDGFEVLQWMQANPQLAGIPVVVLTNLGQKSDEDTARGYGAVEFLIKANVSMNDILAHIEQHLA